MNPDALIAASIFAGAVVLALLIADAVFATLDVRRVTEEVGSRRMRELAWSVAVTAALAVLASFAVDLAARLIWNDPVGGAIILLVTTAVAFLIGIAAILAVVRRERPSYARIRRDLRDRATRVFEPEEVEEYAARLAAADAARERRSQRATPLRVSGVLVVVALAVLVGYLGQTALFVVFLIASAVALVACIVAVRASVVRQYAIDAVLEAERAEVVALLERARIPQRKRVPGLRDRVSKALAILREQQN